MHFVKTRVQKNKGYCVYCLFAMKEDWTNIENNSPNADTWEELCALVPDLYSSIIIEFYEENPNPNIKIDIQKPSY